MQVNAYQMLGKAESVELRCRKDSHLGCSVADAIDSHRSQPVTVCLSPVPLSCCCPTAGVWRRGKIIYLGDGVVTTCSPQHIVSSIHFQSSTHHSAPTSTQCQLSRRQARHIPSSFSTYLHEVDPAAHQLGPPSVPTVSSLSIRYSYLSCQLASSNHYGLSPPFSRF